MALLNPVPLPLRELVPSPQQFLRHSAVHGQPHVGRVMVHAFLLLELTGLREHAHRLWAAVFLHDLARTHDGVCERHGADAAALLDSRPNLLAHLARGGVEAADHEAIRFAVTWHSRWTEPPASSAHLCLTALLKDADGLDRVRIGDLDPARLRLQQSQTLVPFARRLYEETGGMMQDGPQFFERLWPAAQQVRARVLGP
jgi:hypothetical protein